MNESWCSTISGFLFLVTMLALSVLCSSCSREATPVVVDKSEIVRRTPALMAEYTYNLNAEMERRTRP